MTTGSSTTVRRCPLCRHEEPTAPALPRLRDMTLGDAWGVLKAAAARCAILSVLTAIVFGAIYFWRGTFQPVETPPWAPFVLWAGIAVVGYLAAADAAIAVGGWL